jgi:hypothetical protein
MDYQCLLYPQWAAHCPGLAVTISCPAFSSFLLPLAGKKGLCSVQDVQVIPKSSPLGRMRIQGLPEWNSASGGLNPLWVGVTLELWRPARRFSISCLCEMECPPQGTRGLRGLERSEKERPRARGTERWEV